MGNDEKWGRERERGREGERERERESGERWRFCRSHLNT